MDHRVQLRKSIAPLILTSRFYGVLPVSVSQDGHVSVSILGFLHGLCAAIAFGFVHYQSLPTVVQNTNLILDTCFLLSPINTVLGYLSHLCRTRLLAQMYEELFELSEIHSPRNGFWWFTAQVAFSQLIVILAPFIYYATGTPEVIEVGSYIGNVYIIVGLLLLNIQFANVLVFIRRLISMLNHQLESYENNNVSILESRKAFERRVMDLSDLFKCYGRICKFSNLVERCFGVSSVCTAVYTFSTMIMNLYAVIYGRYIPIVIIIIVTEVVAQQWVVLCSCENVEQEVRGIVVQFYGKDMKVSGVIGEPRIFMH